MKTLRRHNYNQYKSLIMYELACETLLESTPEDRRAQLILTFVGEKHDPKEVNRQYRSVASLVREIFSHHVKVVERHDDGAVHFHIMGALRDSFKTVVDAIKYLVRRGLRWGGKLQKPGDGKLYGPLSVELRDHLEGDDDAKGGKGRKPRGYKGIGVFFLSPIEDLRGLYGYLKKQMEDMTRAVKGWARAKLWTPSKGLRVDWRKAMHSRAFDQTVKLMVGEMGLKDFEELRKKLGRYWAVDVLQRKREEEMKAILREDKYADIEGRLLKKLRHTNKLTDTEIEALRKKPRVWRQLRLLVMYGCAHDLSEAQKRVRINAYNRKHGREEKKRRARARDNPSPVPSMRDRFKNQPMSRKSLWGQG